MSNTAQEQRGVLHSVGADGIYLHDQHVFGHNLGRKSVHDRSDSWVPFSCGDMGIQEINVLKGNFPRVRFIAKGKKRGGGPIFRIEYVFGNHGIFKIKHIY